jgi:glucokinase
MFNKTIIGVDLGGTKIGVGKVEANQIVKHFAFNVSSQASEEKIVNEIIQAIEKVFDQTIAGIGVGAPSLVDVEKGIVYDVQNIPSWKKVPLKEILENHFHRPVYVNNDANCFAIGEKYFGKGRNYKNMVGLIIGTGMGAGIIINNRLYSGINCGAGEFGSIPYKEHIYEYYCSGQFFINEYGIEGHHLFDEAKKGDTKSLAIFEQFGIHLGNAIMTILFAVDPEAIILGGSVSQAYPFFQETMWKEIRSFPYKHTIERLVIDTTEETQIAILGAAALFYDAQENLQPVYLLKGNNENPS